MSKFVLEVNNVSKRFKLYNNMITGPIKELLFFWKKNKYYKSFWAVKDINFKLKKGEIVGIIGSNGAGKTTLLKMIAGLLKTDMGKITIHGKVTALLAQGVGYHPEFTGRENILYGGMLLGMNKQEIMKKMDSIIEFADIGEFINNPLRTYSSGMKARLIFATSMSIDPDILIVDEALATGDVNFLEKSMKRIEQLCNSGATIIFVSHNLKQIENICNRCIFIEKGKLIFDGPVKKAIDVYIDRFHYLQDQKILKNNINKKLGFTDNDKIILKDIYFSENNKIVNTLAVGKEYILNIKFESKKHFNKVKFILVVYSQKSSITYAFCPAPKYLGFSKKYEDVFSLTKGLGNIKVKLTKLALGDGKYNCNLLLYPGYKNYKFSYETCYLNKNDVLQFQVIYKEKDIFGRGTLAEIPAEYIKVEMEK